MDSFHEVRGGGFGLQHLDPGAIEIPLFPQVKERGLHPFL
jgi:hypothetical protein